MNYHYSKSNRTFIWLFVKIRGSSDWWDRLTGVTRDQWGLWPGDQGNTGPWQRYQTTVIHLLTIIRLLSTILSIICIIYHFPNMICFWQTIWWMIAVKLTFVCKIHAFLLFLDARVKMCTKYQQSSKISDSPHKTI